MKWPASIYLATLAPAKASYLLIPAKDIVLGRTVETIGGIALGAVAIWPIYNQSKAFLALFILATMATFIGIENEHTVLFRSGRVCMELIIACLISQWVLAPPERRRRSPKLAYLCLLATAFNTIETTICAILAPAPTTTDALTPACARALGSPAILLLPATLYIFLIWRATIYLRVERQ